MYLYCDFFTVYLLEKYRNFVKCYEVLSEKRNRRIKPKLASFQTTLFSACFANCKLLAADKQTAFYNMKRVYKSFLRYCNRRAL